ncbi:hypothetical protein V500_01505 [Pseudogymnoascus sp. VKM F-4518 (FW-2643)]|nr:hypothetical protein V500_01505 [Pseudogymnoascus sp. VKM F-4518 (FW-2643)]
MVAAKSPAKAANAKTAEARAKRKAEVRAKVKQANNKLEELTKHDEEIQIKLKELRKKYDNGVNPQYKEELDALQLASVESGDKLMNCQTDVEMANKEEIGIDKMDVDSLFVEEENNGSDGPSSSSSHAAQEEQQALAENSPVTDNTQPGADVDSPPPSSPTYHSEWLKQALRSRHNTPANVGETTDFGRWTPAEEDENNLITPEQARTAAGIETDGTIVAWAKSGFSKPVIVRYGPRNARKYKRSTAFRESDFLDESNTEKFGPKHRKGDEKDEDGQLVRKSHEFKGIIGVAFNCPVEDLALKVKIKREKGAPPSPPSPRYPRTEVLVKWEIAGEVSKCWEVRSSIKHLFSSFCDQYIYQAALHGEKQYNAWKAGERKSKDRSPTPAPKPWGSVPPATETDKGKQAVDLTLPKPVQVKEEGADNPPTTTALTPLEIFKAD